MNLSTAQLSTLTVPPTAYETKTALKRWNLHNRDRAARGKSELAFKPFLQGARNKITDYAEYN